MNTFFKLVAIAGLSAGLSVASADDAATQELDVVAQPLSTSLRQVAEEFDLKIAFYTESTEGLNAPPLAGTYTPDEALDTLLADTRLEYTYVNDTSVAVRPVAAVEEVSEPGKFQPASSQVLMAQNQTSAAQTITSLTTDQRNENDAPPVLEEIIVTGSNIRGIEAVGAAVVTMDRKYIEMSGLATTQELIQSVPQNFGAGANEANAIVGVGTGSLNFGFSSSVNLRGLGTESTLLLLNGRRSAPGGGDGDFVDLNSIPTAAIERIEVLPDGASALYGSDAVGGVVNVILRNDYEGAQTSIRYAPGTSDIDEIQFSQVFGKSWDTGNVLLTYEYYDRKELDSADRVYTSDSDLTRLGGTNRSSNLSNPGNIISPFTFADGFAIPTGQDGTALTPADLIDLDPATGNPDAINLQNILEGSYVLPEQTRHSVFISARQELSNTIELFSEARYSTREFEVLNNTVLSGASFLIVPESNAFFVDPFAGAATGVCQGFFGAAGNCAMLNYNFVDDYGPPRSSGDVDTVGGTLGATFALSNSWELEVYGSYNSEKTFNSVDRVPNNVLLAAALADSDPATAFNPFGDGSFTNPATLAAIEAFINAEIESELTVFNVRADGELFSMPGGAAKLAIGAQFRDESFKLNQLEFINTPTPVTNAFDFNLDRDVTAAFAEIYLPFVTDENSRPGIQKLAVSIAARYEDYSDFGDTIDPKLGVAWSPVDSLNLRGTIGTSFRAPLLTERNDSNRDVRLITGLSAFGSPPPFENVIFLRGNNPDVGPQEGTTWTAGFDVTPTSVQGLKVGVTYFDTEVDDLIARPGGNLLVPLLDLEAFAPIVTVCPCDAATINALYNDPDFTGTPIPVDQINAIVDSRLGNIASSTVSGVDLDASYAFETEAGAFNLSIYASHLFEFEEQFSPLGPARDNVDTIGKPTSLRLRGGLTWSNGGLHGAIFGNHIGDYIDDLSDPQRRVSSWTTWNLNAGYDFGNRSAGFLDGAKLSLNIQNVFDKDPPFVDGSNGVGFDSINASPIGQFASIQLSKDW